ncbi:hypothetical protein CO610_02110 [Lysobacteraceae bacterium NML95-0200]|nr:hypothetical protein CO610_02110 [Xanthomonadaceae bacterium NML95-0200]
MLEKVIERRIHKRPQSFLSFSYGVFIIHTITIDFVYHLRRCFRTVQVFFQQPRPERGVLQIRQRNQWPHGERIAIIAIQPPQVIHLLPLRQTAFCIQIVELRTIALMQIFFIRHIYSPLVPVYV